MTAQRRIGATDSATRAKLLDAAEQLMMEEGYAAVTSRRVGKQAGVASQLVHYYFHTMDDLFLEVIRRRSEAGLAAFAALIEGDLTLRTLWKFQTGQPGAQLTTEFAALARVIAPRCAPRSPSTGIASARCTRPPWLAYSSARAALRRCGRRKCSRW